VARGGVTAPPGAVLGEFAACLETDALPARVRERVKDLILDAIASALGGLDDSATAVMTRTAQRLFGEGSSTVICGPSLSPAGATFVNAHLVSAVSLCDVHYESWCHLTPQAVAAALVSAEGTPATGADVIAAVAAGCEVTARIGLGLDYPVFHAKGWNTSGVAGVFGAAAATGKLLGLDAAAMTHALGIAGAQSAGSDAHRGTPTVRFLQPRAAVSGLLSAHLAAEGFTAMADVLTDPFGGVYFMYSGGGKVELALDGLSERWELEQTWLTPWPLAVLMRNVVNTACELFQRTDARAETVENVTVSLSPRVYALYGEMPFDIYSRAKTSPRYVTAVALHHPQIDLTSFGEDAFLRDDVRAFANERVDVVEDATLDERAVTMEVKLAGGATHTHGRAVAHGDPADPLTREEIEAKLEQAAAANIDASAVRSIVDFVGSLEERPSINPLLELVRR
jgi:2-methylcitrate dehydratase PrpD